MLNRTAMIVFYLKVYIPKSLLMNDHNLGDGDNVSETVEASLELARMALINVGVNDNEREDIIEEFRQSYHAKIDDVIRGGLRLTCGNHYKSFQTLASTLLQVCCSMSSITT
jgi:hypothetical protein